MKYSVCFFLAALFLCATAHADQLHDGEQALKNNLQLKALKLLKPLAEQGNVVAQGDLGLLFIRGGAEIKKDPSESAKWYGKILSEAQEGDLAAQEAAGAIYHDGVGSKTDWDNGWGIKPNWVEALSWFQKASNKGNWQAQMFIGKIYWDGGWGVAPDKTKASTAYYVASKEMQHAAEGGDAEAAFRLAQFYVEGVEPMRISRNLEEALKWYLKSAGLGNRWAAAQLAKMYKHENGDWGVKQDYGEAYFWNTIFIATGKIAGSHSCAKCDHDEEELAGHLTPDQKTALDARIAQWIKLHS